ncbi:MAG: hypothetical protein ABFD15_04080 [Methanofastidiosum sp.]
MSKNTLFKINSLLELKGIRFALAILGAFFMVGGGGCFTLMLFMAIANVSYLPMTYINITGVCIIAIGLLISGGLLNGLSHGGWN